MASNKPKRWLAFEWDPRHWIVGKYVFGQGHGWSWNLGPFQYMVFFEQGDVFHIPVETLGDY